MHLVLAFYASPKKLALIEDFVNNKLSYPVEGKVRTGDSTVFLSKLPGGLYDLRCQEAIAPFVLRDLSALCTGRPRVKDLFRRTRHERLDTTKSTRMHFLLHAACWLVRVFSPLKDLSPAPEYKKEYEELRGWHYCFFIGAYPDAKTVWGYESL